MATQTIEAPVVTAQERFENILSRERFTGLKAILASLSRDRAALHAGVGNAQSYEELLTKLGYKVTLTKQIHLADCYTRVGLGGEIRVVLPYNDIPTQSSLPTLVNHNATVTTTPKAAAFFNALLAEFKLQLTAQT